MSLKTQQLVCLSESVTHHYLCHYLPRSVGSDELSQSLIRFKRGWPLHVQAWTECSTSALKEIQLSERTIIVRPLNSNEIAVTRSPDTPLDELGRKIALAFNCRYLPHCLTKTKKTERIKMLSRSERETELSNAYVFNRPDVDFGLSEIVIIDDILTTERRCEL